MQSMPRSLAEGSAHPSASPDPMGNHSTPDLSRSLSWLLLLGGIIGTAAAFVLTVEKVALLTDPALVPSCNLNPVLNCGSIMRTDQAEAFGFPNPLIGLATFPVLATTGAALLAGARLLRWYWLGLQIGVTLAVLFVGWLIFQSLYRIDALCPYCMVVWAVVIPTFWYVTLANLRLGCFPVSSKSRLGRTVLANRGVILTCVFVGLIGLVTHWFWDYWLSVLT